jgi:hypothetical protein
MKKTLQLTILCLSIYFLLSVPKASAHGQGPPYAKLNGQYITSNPVVSAGGLGFAPISSFNIGSDSTTAAYLINEELAFEIDEQYFPNPYTQANPFVQSSDQKPMAVVYRWDFGDGMQTMDGRAVTHIYKKPGTYIISQSVQYPEKNKEFTPINTIQLDIVPSKDYKRPVAKITVNGKQIKNSDQDTVSVKPAELVTFDASNSEGRIVTYQWDFGDEKNDVGKNVKHRYDRDSLYPVAVARVTDNLGISNDTYVLIDLPFSGDNPIQKIWFAISDFFTSLFNK